MGQQRKGYRTSNETAVAAPEMPMGNAGNGTELTLEHDAPTVHIAPTDTKPASRKSAEPCGLCGSEQSAIRINVDGNTLLMESCDTCDVRRWQLEGERIDLQEALNQVGEHSGRKRPRA